MQLSNKVYDFIKWLVMVVLPAVSAAYFGLGAIWGLPAIEQVVGTIAVISTFLGALVGISTKQYRSSGSAYDGEILLVEDPGGVRQANINVTGDPEELLLNNDSLLFKVVKNVVPE